MDLPVKTREFENHHFDSARWNGFRFRDGDIVVSSWAKSGTTWMQQIVGQLIFEAAEHVAVSEISPWVDFRIVPRDVVLGTLEAQTHRRFMKTHLPLDALVFSEKAKYIVLGRDPRDVLISWYNHHRNFSESAYDAFNNLPGRFGPPLPKPKSEIREYFNDWLEMDGYPFHPYWSHLQSWWDFKALPNVLFVHFRDMKLNIRREIGRVAAFLDIPVSDDILDKASQHSSLDYMRANAVDIVPLSGTIFRDGAKAFINTGLNDGWKKYLKAEDSDKLWRVASDNLSPGALEWIRAGGAVGRTKEPFRLMTPRMRRALGG